MDGGAAICQVALRKPVGTPRRELRRLRLRLRPKGLIKAFSEALDHRTRHRICAAERQKLGDTVARGTGSIWHTAGTTSDTRGVTSASLGRIMSRSSGKIA